MSNKAEAKSNAVVEATPTPTPGAEDSDEEVLGVRKGDIKRLRKLDKHTMEKIAKKIAHKKWCVQCWTCVKIFMSFFAIASLLLFMAWETRPDHNLEHEITYKCNETLPYKMKPVSFKINTPPEQPKEKLDEFGAKK